MADKVLELFHMVQVRDSLDMDRRAGLYDMRDHDMAVLLGQIELMDKLIAAVEDDEGRGQVMVDFKLLSLVHRTQKRIDDASVQVGPDIRRAHYEMVICDALDEFDILMIEERMQVL